IRLAPAEPAAYNQRAVCWCLKGQRARALVDHREALQQDPDNANTLNHLAWLLATSPEEVLRDGEQAVSHATRACELTGWKIPAFLDTLAAAYAACGRFDEAQRWQQQALDSAEVAGKPQYKARLDLYRIGQPYREPATDEA